MSTAYLKFLQHPFELFRTRKVLRVNPTVENRNAEPDEIKVVVYDYHCDDVQEQQVTNVEECYKYLDSNKVSWINIDGLRKRDIENVCNHYGVHHLIMDDILSIGHRPKMDDIEGKLFCLMNMLYFNDADGSIETEQISIVLGNNFVISFQEEPYKDVFDTLRRKLKIPSSKVRQNGADYLFYTLLDLIVDHYFLVMEKLGERIEALDDDIVQRPDSMTLGNINILRKEMILLNRTIAPMREMISGILKSENPLIEEKNQKYFKDVHDHIIQATELADNYRDMMMNLQDLYINNLSLKMNGVMKVLAVVTCLLAPATIITGIFGMNFEHIPLEHTSFGFLMIMIVMLLIPVWMIWVFKRRGWF